MATGYALQNFEILFHIERVERAVFFEIQRMVRVAFFADRAARVPARAVLFAEPDHIAQAVFEIGPHFNDVDPGRPNKYPMASWYHKPSDEYRSDWDLTGTMANVNMIYSVGLSLSNDD